MDKGIMRRLSLLEQRYPAGGVAILCPQPDNTWELILSGKRHTFKTESEARGHIRPDATVIIDDL